MRIVFLFVVLVAVVAPAAASKVTVIRAGFLIDTQAGEVLRNRAILVRDDRVVAVTEDTADFSSDATVIDLSNAWVMPGFADMHTHVTAHLDNDYFAGLFQSPHRATIGGVVNARKTLLAGFTTIRNVGAGDFQDVALRNAIDAGEVPGPRLFVSGPPLGITGGHCDDNALHHGFSQKADGVADGPWAVRQMVRRNVKYGVDLIKFCATGGVFSRGTKLGQQQYTLEEMQAIVEEAHMHGRTVAAHAHGNEGIKTAIAAGVDSIEHASYLDADAIRMAKKAGVAFSMDIYNTEYTLAEGEKNGVPEENLRKERTVGGVQRESFAAAVKAGADVVFGSDSGVYPHGLNGRQFARMVSFGMTQMQAIQAATVGPARLLKQADHLGQVAEGYYADIVAVRMSPLDDISVLEQVEFVMKGGVVYKEGGKPTAALLD